MATSIATTTTTTTTTSYLDFTKLYEKQDAEIYKATGLRLADSLVGPFYLVINPSTGGTTTTSILAGFVTKNHEFVFCVHYDDKQDNDIEDRNRAIAFIHIQSIEFVCTNYRKGGN